MRGKLAFRPQIDNLDRITPAGAGKTIPLCRAKTQRQDHPRRCGENVFRKVKKLVRTGSPPQVRGKLDRYAPDAFDVGITPAGAGKTISSSVHCKPQRDHPRRCGENFIVLLAEQAEMGSPPQVRGKPY